MGGSECLDEHRRNRGGLALAETRLDAQRERLGHTGLVGVAGRYRPRLGELDCIGIVLTQWDERSDPVPFRFRLPAGPYPQLHDGDFVQIVWNHLDVGVHVKYGPDGVPPGS